MSFNLLPKASIFCPTELVSLITDAIVLRLHPTITIVLVMVWWTASCGGSSPPLSDVGAVRWSRRACVHINYGDRFGIAAAFVARCALHFALRLILTGWQTYYKETKYVNHLINTFLKCTFFNVFSMYIHFNVQYL